MEEEVMASVLDMVSVEGRIMANQRSAHLNP